MKNGGDGYHEDWLRPRGGGIERRNPYENPAKNRIEDVKFEMREDEEEESFEDFIKDAQEFSDNWDDNEPEDVKDRKAREFAMKHKDQLAPFVVLGVGICLFVVCLGGCCCLAVCALGGLGVRQLWKSEGSE